ncbi:nucleotidyl transferase AbiEii/AbiGii toxin family protein [Chlamydiota bacterium]
MDYLSIFKTLNELNIDYVVVGGLAVNFLGIPRMTYDIDIIINLDDENIKKIIKQFIHWGYKPKIPINPIDFAKKEIRQEWIEQKNMHALCFYSDKYPLSEIDILIKFPLSYKEIKVNAQLIDLNGLMIPTICKDDLITMKTYSSRKQDFADIENLKKI